MIWGLPVADLLGNIAGYQITTPSASWWDPQRMMVLWTSPSILKPTYRILKGCKRHISRQSPPEWMTNHDLTVESRILHSHFPHRPQRSHHCAEAPYERPRQRPACRIVRPGKSPRFFRESKKTVDVQDGKPLIDIDWGIFPGILGGIYLFSGIWYVSYLATSVANTPTTRHIFLSWIMRLSHLFILLSLAYFKSGWSSIIYNILYNILYIPEPSQNSCWWNSQFLWLTLWSSSMAGWKTLQL